MITRPTGVTRSYIVEVSNHNLDVKLTPSKFVPGYTNAHKETPEEAIEYAFSKVQKEIERLEEVRELIVSISCEKERE